MTTPPYWRKSTHSGADEGDCVEVAGLDGHIGIRDSKNPAAGHLTLTRQAFTALLTHLTSRPRTPHPMGEAVRAYPAARREEMRQAMLDKLRELDGSAASSVSVLTDTPAEDIERLGGISMST